MRGYLRVGCAVCTACPDCLSGYGCRELSAPLLCNKCNACIWPWFLLPWLFMQFMLDSHYIKKQKVGWQQDWNPGLLLPMRQACLTGLQCHTPSLGPFMAAQWPYLIRKGDGCPLTTHFMTQGGHFLRKEELWVWIPATRGRCKTRSPPSETNNIKLLGRRVGQFSTCPRKRELVFCVPREERYLIYGHLSSGERDTDTTRVGQQGQLP